MGVKWWNDWDIGNGTIGQRYGATVKRYDLVNNLIKDIRNDPYGRRKIMSLWQESDLHETPGLAPCAFLTIWNVRNKGDKEYLDMVLVQRSGDLLTASGPGGINEVQYAALLMMIARHTNYLPGVFSHFVANEQIYDRHQSEAMEIYGRGVDHAIASKTSFAMYPPKLVLSSDVTNFYDFRIEHFEMKDYYPITPQIELELGI